MKKADLDEIKGDTKDSYKKAYEEAKRNNLMDWGLIELAESVQEGGSE